MPGVLHLLARASVASITKNVEALAEEYGNLVELACETCRTFPAPEWLNLPPPFTQYPFVSS